MSRTPTMEKAEAVPPVFFRIKPEVHTRLEKVLKGHSGGRNDLARDGLLREIERLEQQASPVSAKEAKAIAAFRKVTGGGDICPVLANAMRDHVLRAAATSTCLGPAIQSSTGAASVRVVERSPLPAPCSKLKSA